MPYMEQPTSSSDDRLVRAKAVALAVPAVYGLAPFDSPVCASMNPVLGYLSALPQHEREKGLQAVVKAAQFFIGGEPFREQAALDELSAIKRKALKRSFTPTPPRVKGWSETPIAVEVFARRMPGFELDSSVLKPALKSTRGVLTFACELKNSSGKAVIALDFGTNPGPLGFSCSIGITRPLFLMDIGAPFATGNYWPYFDADSFRLAIERALDVVAIVLPEFLLKATEVNPAGSS